MSATSTTAGPSGSSQGGSQPVPAPPPSKSEIERKLSFRSAAAPTPRQVSDTKQKAKKYNAAMPPNPYSGNESDSSVTSSSVPANAISPAYPPSPLLSSAPGSIGTRSTADRDRIAVGKVEAVNELDEMELEDVEEEGEEGDGEGDESEEVEKEGGDLQRGMEGERVLKSGYLLKKQERRKAWKRKWFVLRTNKLAYYKDDREYSLKRVFDLKSIQAVAPVTIKKHSFSFGIVTAKRTFLAKASSQDEMDDWVRAINSARRRLSEREEEERVKRSGSAPVAVPPRQQSETIDTSHGGTYPSVFSSTGTSITASPVASSAGYFAPHPSSGSVYAGSPIASPGGLSGAIPPSPLDTAHVLPNHMAGMHINKPGSSSGQPRMPRSISGISTSGARRETSASSIGSLDQYYQAYGSLGLHPTVSSDEDEPYFSDPTAAFQANIPVSANINPSSAAPVDPNKIILSSYLMKRSKGRGRKVWRKRWFYLTSQGLTYTKSHMDSRPLRFIPLSAVVDALEFDADGSESEGSDSDFQAPSISSAPGRPARQFSVRGTKSDKAIDKPGTGGDEHLFRVVTAKRTFVLCAPSEEDEIKWLAAFRALLTRQRENLYDGAPMSPTMETAPRMSVSSKAGAGGVVPTITQQPPTPLSIPPTVASAGSDDPATPAATTSAGPPILERPVETQPSAGGRGRSATYVAKGAVADVVRRYHPEQAREAPPPVPQLQQ